MKNEDILKILYPPDWTADLLHFYISGTLISNSNGAKAQLVYFVLPILGNPNLRTKLNKATKASSFNTIFKDHTEFFIGLANKADSFFSITNNGLIYLGSEVNIIMNDFLSIDNTVDYQDYKSSNFQEYFKAAYNLGIIFEKEDYKNLFLKMGVYS